MTFFVILGALIALLYTGLPMFAGMFLFSVAVLYAVEGGIPTLGEFIVGQLDGYLLTKLHIPDTLVRLAVDYEVSKYQFLVIVMLMIFVLGLILESFSIIMITTPVLLPVMAQLGIDRVWYGILLTINLELALISP